MQDIQKMTDAELVEAVAVKMAKNTEYSLEFLIAFITASLLNNHEAVRIVLEAVLMAERGKK